MQGFDDNQKTKVDVKEHYSNASNSGVILNNWYGAKREYDQAKAKLDTAKEHLLNFTKNKIDVGTTRLSTDRFVLKVNQTEKYTVDDSNMQGLNEVLGIIAYHLGSDVAQKLIVWKPTLNKTVYNNLPPQAIELLQPYISMSYNSPSFSVEVK